MRNIFLFMMVSVDGYFEGKDHSIDWHNTDEEFNDFAIKQTSEVGTLLFGRTTYELMASYWPTDAALEDSKEIAELMNSLPKVVFSKTLQSVDWNNTNLVHENAAEEVKKLKDQPGKDIAIFGSSDLTVSLLKDHLVDELRIMVNPVVLGDGKRLFQGLNEQLKLELKSSRNFKNGNILLNYKVL